MRSTLVRLERVAMVVAGTTAGALVVRFWRIPHRDRIDFHLYRAAAHAWVPGHLSGFRFGFNGLRFTYPPFAIMLFKALVVLPPLEQLWVISAAGALIGLVWMAVASVDPTRSPPLALVVVAVAAGMLSLPSLTTLRLGQIDALLAALVLLDLRAATRSRRWAGMGTGLAAAIKVTPAVGLLALYVVGHRRAATRGAALAVAATAAAAVVAPADSLRFWTHDLLQTDRVGRLADLRNHSLNGLLARLGPSPGGLALAAGTAAGLVLLLLAARAARRMDNHVAAVSLVMVAATLASPIAWAHHLVWAIPLALTMTLGHRGWSRAVGAVLLAVLAIPAETNGWLTDLRTLVLVVAVLAVVAPALRSARPGRKADHPSVRTMPERAPVPAPSHPARRLGPRRRSGAGVAHGTR